MCTSKSIRAIDMDKKKHNKAYLTITLNKNNLEYVLSDKKIYSCCVNLL